MKPAGIAAAFLIASYGFLGPASGHDRWDNGDPVPSWVKTRCCGKSDVHHIPNEAIRIMADGYHIEGINTVVPFSQALPSPDATYWGFWAPLGEPNPAIFCFFAPPNGM
jgi:hypothetical protein